MGSILWDLAPQDPTSWLLPLRVRLGLEPEGCGAVGPPGGPGEELTLMCSGSRVGLRGNESTPAALPPAAAGEPPARGQPVWLHTFDPGPPATFSHT